MSGLIVKTTRETIDTRTFYIKVNLKDKDYVAGQFLNIDPHQFEELAEIIKFLEYKKGRRETFRAYSISSFPGEDYISITVKSENFNTDKEYPPLLATFLVTAPLVGRVLKFSGYSGSYIFPEFLEKQTSEVLHLVSGSGIIPSFSLLKNDLIQDKNTKVHHTIINVNKTYADIIYREELDKLARKYNNRFTLVHLLTRERKDGFLYGYPDIELIKRNILNLKSVLVYICGSKITKWQHRHNKITQTAPVPRFMETILNFMTQLKIDNKQIKIETFG